MIMPSEEANPIILRFHKKCRRISRSTSDLSSIAKSKTHEYRGFLDYQCPINGEIRCYGVLDGENRILLYENQEDETPKRVFPLENFEITTKRSNKNKFQIFLSSKCQIHTISTTDANWVDALKSSRLEYLNSPEFNQRNIKSRSASVENFQKELATELDKVDHKRNLELKLKLKMAHLTNRYDRAHEMVMQESLRQQTSLKMKKISTQMKIDSIQESIKKQFRKSNSQNGQQVDKLIGGLQDELQEIDVHLLQNEKRQANTTEEINESLAKDINDLQSLYRPSVISDDSLQYKCRLRSNSDDNTVEKKTLKIERRKGKFFKRFSSMFKNSFESDSLSPSIERILKSESDTSVPTHFDFTDGLELNKSRSQDFALPSKQRMFPTSQTSFESNNSIDEDLDMPTEISEETWNIISDFEKMIEEHKRLHNIENSWYDCN